MRSRRFLFPRGDPITRLLALTAALTLTTALPGLAATVLYGTDGFEADQDGLALIINDSLSGDKHAIKLNDGNDNSVTNNGLIQGLGKDGINADGANLTVINNGTIIGADEGVQAKDSNGLSVTNFGTIHGDDEGVEGADNVVLTNYGSITAVDDAVNTGEATTITNAGRIENIAGAGDEPQDAIDLDSGTIVNLAGGQIVSTTGDAIDFDATNAPATPSTIVNFGMISGQTGVLVEKGLTGEPANTAAQIVLNSGLIAGTGGLAVDLGAGDDLLSMAGAGRLIGGADMGEGEDMLVLSGLSYGQIADGALIDGGAGQDTVWLEDFLFDDILSAVAGNDGMILSLANAMAQSLSVTLANWEWFGFGDGSVRSLAEVAGDPAPVPLPAGGVLLLGGLAGLAALRRRG